MGCPISIACAVILGSSLLQDSPSKAPPPRPPDGSVTTRESSAPNSPAAEFAGRPTADEILKALQRQRPENEVIPPGGAPNWSLDRKRPVLLPEGGAVVSQSGWLKSQGSWWTFVPDPPDGKPPTRLLPNANLEVMAKTTAGSPSPVKFVVSGEVTVFEDENYLLVRLVRRTAEGAVAAAAPPEPAAIPPPPLARPVVPSPDQSAGAAQVGNAEQAAPDAEDVVALLQQQRPAEELMPGIASPPGGESRSRGTLARTWIPEGTPLISRPGRLLRRGDWWTFVFESDRPDRPEPPVRLLPNKSLELMVKAAEHESIAAVFLVSGEATVFEGENYLLSRVAMRRIDTGNLRR